MSGGINISRDYLGGVRLSVTLKCNMLPGSISICSVGAPHNSVHVLTDGDVMRLSQHILDFKKLLNGIDINIPEEDL